MNNITIREITHELQIPFVIEFEEACYDYLSFSIYEPPFMEMLTDIGIVLTQIDNQANIAINI
jgi:hypothetical protein